MPSHGGVDSLVNLAVNGETSGSFIGSGDGSQLARAIDAVEQETNVRVVTLTIGGNDLLTLLSGNNPVCVVGTPQQCTAALQQTLATFSANYAHILEQLTAALAEDPGNESILVMTYYNPFVAAAQQDPVTFGRFSMLADQALLGADGKIDCAGTGAAIGLNDLIACIGAAYGATVVDVYPAFRDAPIWSTRRSQDMPHLRTYFGLPTSRTASSRSR